MRAILIMDSVSRFGGGLFDAERCLHKTLQRLGISTSVFSLQDTYSTADLAGWAPLRPEFFPHDGPVALGASSSLQRSMLIEPADLIYRAGLWRLPSKYAHDWSKKHKKPEVIAPHGMLDSWAVRNSRWKKRLAHMWFEGAHLREAACIRALCESEAQAIRSYGLKNPVCIIPNGIDLPEEKPETRDPGPEKNVLLFLGRLHPKKGLPNALRAWKQALQSTSGIPNSTFNEWQLVIAGWDQGGHEKELKRLCDELELRWAEVPAAEFVEELSDVRPQVSEELGTDDLSSQSPPYKPGLRSEQSVSLRPTDNLKSATDLNASVLFLGPAFGQTKDALLRRASAFILPSYSEGLPMSVLEAWSYRLPVLMTAHCNIPEGFAADAAIRIDTDVQSIAEGMRLLLRSPCSDLRSLGINGRYLVERQYTWPQVASQMKEVYEWVLGRGVAPNCIRQF